MSANNNTAFLADLALAGFNLEIKHQEGKVLAMEEAARWERLKQNLRSKLSVMLESAKLSRKELNFVLYGVADADPDQLLEKIRFVVDHIPEAADPRRQFTERCKVMV